MLEHSLSEYHLCLLLAMSHQGSGHLCATEENGDVCFPFTSSSLWAHSVFLSLWDDSVASFILWNLALVGWESSLKKSSFWLDEFPLGFVLISWMPRLFGGKGHSLKFTVRWMGCLCPTDSGSHGASCILVTGLLLRDGWPHNHNALSSRLWLRQ